jgi:hypothetical protein
VFQARGGAKGVLVTVLHPDQEQLNSLKEKLVEQQVCG